MVASLVLILKQRKNNIMGKHLFLSGYFFYGLAAFASASRHIGNWYAVVGTKILDFIISGRELSWSASSLGFFFMDLVVEESMELMGATFLLAAVLVYLPLSKYYEE